MERNENDSLSLQWQALIYCLVIRQVSSTNHINYLPATGLGNKVDLSMTLVELLYNITRFVICYFLNKVSVNKKCVTVKWYIN